MCANSSSIAVAFTLTSACSSSKPCSNRCRSLSHQVSTVYWGGESTTFPDSFALALALALTLLCTHLHVTCGARRQYGSHRMALTWSNSGTSAKQPSQPGRCLRLPAKRRGCRSANQGEHCLSSSASLSPRRPNQTKNWDLPPLPCLF